MTLRHVESLGLCRRLLPTTVFIRFSVDSRFGLSECFFLLQTPLLRLFGCILGLVAMRSPILVSQQSREGQGRRELVFLVFIWSFATFLRAIVSVKGMGDVGSVKLEAKNVSKGFLHRIRRRVSILFQPGYVIIFFPNILIFQKYSTSHWWWETVR